MAIFITASPTANGSTFGYPGLLLGFPGGTVVKNVPANAGDARDAGLSQSGGGRGGHVICIPMVDSC